MHKAGDALIKSVIDIRLSALQWRVITICFLVALFDGFDTQAVAFTGPAMIDAFGVDVKNLAPVLTAGIVGMTVGAMLLGMLGDRVGRRITLMVCVLIFSVATLLTAWSAHLDTIFILRVIAGFGMGGATPVLLSLAAEYSPHRHRGLVTTGVLLALPAGAMSGGLLAAEMLPRWGWQSIYLIGGVAPLLLLVVIFFLLPDSLESLYARRSARSLKKANAILSRIAGREVVLPDASTQDAAVPARPVSRLSHLFRGSLRLTTMGIWSVYFFNWVAWFMLLSWLPTLLKQAGLAPADAPYASVTVNAAFIAFALPLSWFLPRINTLKILYLMFAVGIAVALALSVAIPQQLWLASFLLIAFAGFGVGGQQLALNYLVVATYPAAVRATAMGWAIGMGRMGAIVGSAIGGLVLSGAGTGGFFLVLIVPLAVSFASLLLLRRRYVQATGLQDEIAVH